MHCKGCLAVMAVILSGFVLAMPVEVRGDVIVSLNNPGSTTLHEIEVERGQSFDVDVNIAPATDMVGLSFRVRASASNVLSLTDGMFLSPFDMSTSAIPLGALSPTSQELWASVSTFGPQLVSSPFGGLRFTVAPDTQPGAYTLSLSDVYWAESRATEILPGQTGPTFNIQVLPEPVTATLCSIALGMLVGRRRSYRD